MCEFCQRDSIANANQQKLESGRAIAIRSVESFRRRYRGDFIGSCRSLRQIRVDHARSRIFRLYLEYLSGDDSVFTVLGS